MPDFSGIGHFWVYLAASPLLGLTLTLCAYLAAQRIAAHFGDAALANPVAIAIALIALVLWVSNMSYQRYFAGAQFVHFLLGPATVALAIPLARQLPALRSSSSSHPAGRPSATRRSRRRAASTSAGRSLADTFSTPRKVPLGRCAAW